MPLEDQLPFCLGSRNVNYRLFCGYQGTATPSFCTSRTLFSLIFNPWRFQSTKDCYSEQLCHLQNAKIKAKKKKKQSAIPTQLLTHWNALTGNLIFVSFCMLRHTNVHTQIPSFHQEWFSHPEKRQACGLQPGVTDASFVCTEPRHHLHSSTQRRKGSSQVFCTRLASTPQVCNSFTR